jgi:hypothetical protein
MSRFNVRPISTPPPPPVIIPQGKQPSAYSAMKHGSSAPVNKVIYEDSEPEPKKKGRPSKEEIRKRKMAQASARIAMLIDSKHNKSKVSEYISNRILELEEEKK